MAKWDNFSFSIVNYQYYCSTISLLPAYGVYVPQLIRYSRAGSAYYQFLSRGKLLPNKLLLFKRSVWRLHLPNSMVDITISFVQTNCQAVFSQWFSVRINCSPDLDYWLTGRDRSTGDAYPPRNLIPSLVYPVYRFRHAFNFVLLFFWEYAIDTCHFSIIAICSLIL